MAPFREMEMRDGLRASQMATLCSLEAQTNGDWLVPTLGTGRTEHMMTQDIPSQCRRKDHLSGRVRDGVWRTSLACLDSSLDMVRKSGEHQKQRWTPRTGHRESATKPKQKHLRSVCANTQVSCQVTHSSVA